MRVLLLTPEFTSQGGGIASFYRALAPALAREGVTVRVIQGSAAFSERYSSPTNFGGIEVETLQTSNLQRWKRHFTHFSATPSVRDHLAAAWAMWEQGNERADFDLVEASDWGLLFVPPAMAASVPLVVQLHGSIGQISSVDSMIGQDADEVMIRLLERSMVGTLGGLQTSSHANADFWLRHGAKNVVVIPPAVAVPPLPSLPVCSSGLVVGRLQRWKGPDILCGALRLMGSEAPRTRWIGRDVAWTARGQMASRHLATSYPDVWGMLLHHSPPRPHSEVFRLQGGALFNLTPSTWDVFNLTVAEGMASGRPCIASDGAGAAELIDDGESGFLFKAGQSASLAEAIERVLSTSPARLKQIGLSARAVVEARLNPFESAKLRAAAYATARSEFTSRQSAGIDPWLRNACTPRVAQAEIDAAFLTHHPLRLLIRHALARVRGRTATLLRRRTWEA